MGVHDCDLERISDAIDYCMVMVYIAGYEDKFTVGKRDLLCR